MGYRIRAVQYFYASVCDAPGEAYQLLAALASSHVNLLAFSAIPIGAAHAQLTLFPEDPDRLVHAARDIGIQLTGPQRAFLIQGDDRLGALVDIHRKLYEAQVNLIAATGVTDGSGGYGYLLHVRQEDHDKALQVMQLFDSRLSRSG